MKHFRYHFNPETSQPHIYDHGVTESEVEEVFASRYESRGGLNGATIVSGQTYTGRFLKIICKYDADGIGVFVITAYDLQGKPLAAFRRRMRRRFR